MRMSPTEQGYHEARYWIGVKRGDITFGRCEPIPRTRGERVAKALTTYGRDGSIYSGVRDNAGGAVVAQKESIKIRELTRASERDKPPATVNGNVVGAPIIVNGSPIYRDPRGFRGSFQGEPIGQGLPCDGRRIPRPR